MKKIVKTLFLAVAMLLILCSCGRNDITITVNEDGSFDAEIVYGIDKAFVAGEEVINEVAQLIKQPLDEKKIEYKEEDTEKFYLISTKKHFENAEELTDSVNWEGMSFVPLFSRVPMENAILVTTKGGKINFEGTLNSDSFGATELLSENKEAFGASITIIADKAEANVKEENKNTYKWQGNASESVKLELSAKYPKAASIKEADIPLETNDAEKEAVNEKTEEKAEPENEEKAETEKTGISLYIYILAAVVIIIAVIVLIKSKKKQTKGENE